MLTLSLMQLAELSSPAYEPFNSSRAQSFGDMRKPSPNPAKCEILLYTWVSLNARSAGEEAQLTLAGAVNSSGHFRSRDV